MAISKKSVTAGTDNGGSATVTVVTSESPSATASGDLVVVLHANDWFALSNMVAPTATGSPAMNAITTVDGGTNTAHIKAWYYYANTAGAQTISSTETGTHDEEKAIVAVVLGGAAASSPVDGTPGTNSDIVGTQTLVANATSPAATDSYAIVMVSSGAASATNGYTTPAPLGEDVEFHIGTTVGISGVVGTAQLSASGSTGTFTFTGAENTQYAAVTIAIKTAAGATDATVTLLPAQANVTIHP